MLSIAPLSHRRAETQDQGASQYAKNCQALNARLKQVLAVSFMK